jgi:hypothetical protein
MKTILKFLFISTIGFCNIITAQSKVGQSICAKSVPFGDILICLPDIDGMNECYNKPIVNEYLKKLNQTSNPILGCYINDINFKEVDNLNEIEFDDYFVIYALTKMKGVSIDNSKLNLISDIVTQGYIKKNWNELKDKLEINNEYVSYGRPVLIESYSLNDKLKTFVLLSKVQFESSEKFQIQVLNFIQIKKRLISLSYYLDYNGENSFISAKSKNDYSVLLLLEENN